MTRELEQSQTEEEVRTEEVTREDGGEAAAKTEVPKLEGGEGKSPGEEKEEVAETAGEEMDSIVEKGLVTEDDEGKEENNEPEEEQGEEEGEKGVETPSEEEKEKKEEVTDREQTAVAEVATEVDSHKDRVEVGSPEPSEPTEGDPQEGNRLSKRRRDEEEVEEEVDRFSRRIIFKPSTSDTDPSDDEQMTFREAEQRIRQLPKFPSDQDVLLAYALHQQSLLGDNNTEVPLPLDFVGKEKWDCWSELKGLTQEDAKLRFIHLVRRLELELDP